MNLSIKELLKEAVQISFSQTFKKGFVGKKLTELLPKESRHNG